MNNNYSWTASLMDPCNKGARVPDPFTMTATGVFQSQLDSYYSANAGGMVGVIFDPRTFTEYALDTDAVVNDFDWTQANPFTPDVDTRYFLDHFTSQWRVVSACLDIVYTGTTAQDSGIGLGFIATGAQIGASPKTGFTTRYLPHSFGQIDDFVDSAQFPVRNGMRVLWKPIDTTRATEFIQLDSTAGFQSATGSLFGYFASGMTPGATLMIKKTINYEFIPKNDAMDVIPTARPDFEQSKLDWRRGWEWVADKSNKILPLFGGWSGAANQAAQFLGSQLFNNRSKPMYAVAA